MSWWKDTARNVAEVARNNPGMSADRLADRAVELYNQQKQPVAAGNSYTGPLFKYRPALDARESKAASMVAGVAHDSFRLQPRDLSPEVMRPIVSWTDQYYEKMDKEEAEGLFRTLPAWQQQAWANAAQALGGGPRTAESTFNNYVEMSGYLSARGINKDPFDLLAEDVATGYMPPSLFDGPAVDTGSSGSSYYGGGGGGYGGGGGGGGGQVSLTNPTSAKGLLMQTMQQALGRNPTQNEYSQFLKILNEAEMANPQTVSVEGDVVVGSGGVDPGVLALEFAQDQEDWQERQGDQYFQVFMQSLAGGA
jgi:hypothetical protein